MCDDFITETGNTLVRRFTDELAGDNLLEVETKAAQEQLDLVAEQQERARLELFWDDKKASHGNFRGTELARKKLQEACDRVLTGLKKKKTLFRRGTSAAERLERKLSEIDLLDINSFKNVVEELQGEWERKHGKAYSYFQNVCRSLMDYKEIFAVFPSQNVYTQTLCGALSLIVQASVNHTEHAEKLASSIAQLSKTVTDSRDYTLLIKTDRIQKLFAEIYEKFFLYLLEAIIWYLKPSHERLLDSFNTTLVDRCTDTVTEIKEVVERMRDYAWIAMLAMQRHEISLLEETRAVSMMSQQTNVNQGEVMIRLLHMMAKFGLISGQPQILPIEPAKVEVVPDERPSTSIEHFASREDARRQMEPLLRSDCGTDGLSTIAKRSFHLSDPLIVSRLAGWLETCSKSHEILWVWSYEYRLEPGISTPEATALTTIRLVLHTKVPFISHICCKAAGLQGNRDTREHTGLLALVYDLIYQLLQFGSAENDANIPTGLLDQLDGKLPSWVSALELLELLLRQTTVLKYCIIHGLNVLETGGANEWCGQFLDLLVSHFHLPTSSTSFLFTTSGQSQELAPRITKTSRKMVIDESHLDNDI